MSLRLSFSLAHRELRGGFGGLRVFLACLTLGVAAIATSGVLNAGVRAALQADARILLGGDLEVERIYRAAEPEELRALQAEGTVSHVVRMRTMARPPAGTGRPALVELKAVDTAYPLYGRFEEAEERGDLQALLARRDGAWGAVADANLLERLGLKLGDRVRVGQLDFELRGVVGREPDRVTSAFALGPRLMIPEAALPETALLQPGSLLEHEYRIAYPAGADPAMASERIREALADGGYQIRDPSRASPGVGNAMGNVSLFLTLVGLTSLLVGGIGVANGVRAYLAARIETIAVLKSLGATSGRILSVYGIQVAELSLLGVAIGMALGLVLSILGAAILADFLPILLNVAVVSGPLLLAGLFGLMIAGAFALWPLGLARLIPPATLFRGAISSGPAHPGGIIEIVIGALVGGLALLAVFTAQNPAIALWFVVGAAGSMMILALAARFARWSAAAARPGARPGLRLALANLHRPGAATQGVVLSLGLGLVVLVAVALIETNLRRQLDETIPARAPAFFVVDIQPDQRETFTRLVTEIAGPEAVTMAMMIRGRIVKVNGKNVREGEVSPEVRWAVRGDRGLSSAATQPEGSEVVAGQWWPADYQGPPLVSLDANIAAGLGLGVGDSITVNVLGRDLTAEIANLRRINWASLAMNFTFVFSPGPLEAAPRTYLATIRAKPEQELAIERAVTTALPNISAVRVKEALESARGIVDAGAVAVRAAAALTVLVGALVLAGAFAAEYRRRVQETVILKVLGATRRRLLGILLLEYGLLGLLTGIIAAVLGTIAAWAVTTEIMRASFTFNGPVVAATIVFCLVLTMALGAAATARVLGRKAAPYLRNE